MTVSVSTKSSFHGRMYVEGFPYDSRCSIPYGTYNSSNLVMSVPLVPCVTSFSHNGSVAYVRISTHPVGQHNMPGDTDMRTLGICNDFQSPPATRMPCTEALRRKQDPSVHT